MKRHARILRDAAGSLRAHAQRTLIMTLAVAAAVAVLSAVIVAGQGTRQRVQELVNKHGLDMIMIRAGGDVQVFAPTADRGLTVLMDSDARAIARELPNVRMVSVVQNKRGINVTSGSGAVVTRAFGVEPDWSDIRRWGIAEGEFLTHEDLAGMARVAVLGQKVASALFPDGGAVGSPIRVNGEPYAVRGVFIPMGVDAGGDDWDHRIVVPFTTSSRRLFERPYLEQIVLRVHDARRVPETAERIRDLLRVRHGIGAGRPDDFFVREPADIEGAALETSTTTATLLAMISVAGLIAAGIVIMNVMLLSVAQRAREIAVRRAVGARASDIARQFVAEALLVAIAGGTIGVFLGIAAAQALAAAGVAQARVDWIPFAAALLVCAVIAVVFAWRPARAAAALDPVVSLRARGV